ncbi:hypothetical protein IKQ26_00715 [bacterium]|nr:hypothetical protein [bacterium]
MAKYVKTNDSNAYAVVVIFDIISKILFVCASVVLIYWLLAPFLSTMGIPVPSFISSVCEKPYGLAHMVGYVHRSGFNFAGGIAAVMLFILGYIFEIIRNFVCRH